MLIPTGTSSGEAPSLPFALIVAAALLAVAAVQLVRLGAGLAHLRAIRRAAQPLEEPRWLSDLRSRVAPAARFVMSDSSSSPATFGVVRPMIVLPSAFGSLSVECQRAVALHELIHAKRRDWLVLIGEELLKAILCLHPAVHWLVGRIRLAREQCVDAEVVRWLGSRRTYLESLVEVGRLSTHAERSPAAPFLRERHLRERVELLLKEDPMTRVRSLTHLGLTAATLGLAAALAVGIFPMAAPSAAETVPSSSSARPAVQQRVAPTKKVHNVQPTYPKDAKAEGVQGIFLIAIKIDTAGHISDALVIASAPSTELLQSIPKEKIGTPEALRGDERLARAAVEDVRQWRYEPVLDEEGKPKELQAVVTVNFKLKDSN